MRLFRSARWLLLALLLPLIPAPRAHAGVFISVGYAPPVLPVYVQPPCPQPDWVWTPGYWAYDYDSQSYYWVPGAWVPAPYEGVLWTPPYWGWETGMYVFHPGYWGPEVGYYGGVNYGFGYMGIGFIGGRWHEHHFEYNTAVVHVNERIIHTTYIDRTVIRTHEVAHDSRVAYSGGPGGIRHDPLPEERRAMQMQHVAPTQAQAQHIQAARSDRTNFFNVNHGRPQNAAVARPLAAPANAGPRPGNSSNLPNGTLRNNQPGRPQAQPMQQQRPDARPQTPAMRPQYGQRPNQQPQYQSRQDARPAQPQYQPRQDARPAQQQPKPRPAQPQYQPPRQESRPAPEARPQQQPRPESHPAPQEREPRPGPENERGPKSR